MMAPPRSRWRSLVADAIPARFTGTDPVRECDAGVPANPTPMPSTATDTAPAIQRDNDGTGCLSIAILSLSGWLRRLPDSVFKFACCFAHDFRKRNAPEYIIFDKHLRQRQQTRRRASRVPMLERQHQVADQRRSRRVFLLRRHHVFSA